MTQKPFSAAPRSRSLVRLLFAALAFAFALVAFSAPAFAGSYLTRAALMLDQARKEGDTLQPRTYDKELVAVVKAMAEARARAGRKMEVPVAVGKAHPHLLLVLEHAERAADAADKGDFKKFMTHLMASRDEEKIFRAVLRELGHALPDVGSKK